MIALEKNTIKKLESTPVQCVVVSFLTWVEAFPSRGTMISDDRLHI